MSSNNPFIDDDIILIDGDDVKVIEDLNTKCIRCGIFFDNSDKKHSSAQYYRCEKCLEFKEVLYDLTSSCQIS